MYVFSVYYPFNSSYILILVNMKTVLYFFSFYYSLVHDPTSMLIALITGRV